MELSELTAYAEEKFHIQEQHKWADFPGFSVLADPNTGKWIALLMRQWDYDTGTEIQRCDIKCGQQSLAGLSEPYLSLPFRMKGKKWVGVRFDSSTKPDVIFRLFDRAVYSGEERGYTIVLEEAPAKQTTVCQDTALPTVPQQFQLTDPKVPGKIRDMLRMYEYKGGFFSRKCRNFYRQGRFMEDYEDDAPWNGTYRHYFPTYHDLNIRQLRGYFTWRTRVRKGDYTPIATSLAYLYLYELLNGIGTESPEDSLRKMSEFETGFLDSGLGGDAGMRKNLHRWMLEYAVIHAVPASLARKYADPATLEKDESLEVLRNPKESADEEIFSALCALAGKKLEQSPVVRKDRKKGIHFFAEVWRYVSETYSRDNRDFFTACFGEQKTFLWRPLANAVYWEEHPHPDTDYVLDACRTYHCRGGVWREQRYDHLYFDRKRLRAFLHEADRRLRKYLKTGHYLRENPDEAWAAPYVEAVIEAERQSEIEAARPKITIDLSSLEQIRQDARITRDSLLTEEDMDAAGKNGREDQQNEEYVCAAGGERQPADERQARETGGGRQPADDGRAGENGGEKQSVEECGGTDGQEKSEVMPGMPASLDELHRKILLDLLRGGSSDACIADIKAGHLMPSVVADTINEAFFDEIGDNILTCDGDTITLVEDYREDVLQMLERV